MYLACAAGIEDGEGLSTGEIQRMSMRPPEAPAFVDDQIVYSYNSIANVFAMRNGFDVTKPVSLLYKKDEMGMMKLTSAPYKRAMPNAALRRAVCPSDEHCAVEARSGEPHQMAGT